MSDRLSPLPQALRAPIAAWKILAGAAPVLFALGTWALSRPSLADVNMRLVPIEARLTAAEARNFANEQWNRDAAALQVEQMASHTRLEAALYEADPRLRAQTANRAELKFREDADAVLGGYWAMGADERRNYNLAGKLSLARQRALGTAGAAPP